MTNPTGDALKASAAQVPTAYLVKRYDLSGVLLDTELSFTKPVIRSTSKTEFTPLYAAFSPPVEQAPQPVGWVVNRKGDGLFLSAKDYDEATVIREAAIHGRGYFAVGVPTEAPTVEQSQAAEIARLREAMKIALEVMENVDGENDCSRGIRAVEAALASEGSAE